MYLLLGGVIGIMTVNYGLDHDWSWTKIFILQSIFCIIGAGVVENLLKLV